MKRFTITEEERTEILRLYLTEDIEHTKKLYSNWAKSKSGNYDMAMLIMNDVLYYRKNLPKKDFAKYNSYEELKSDLDNIKMKSQEKEIKNTVEKDVDKLYEDDKLLIVKAKTWEASCKYGAGTKWCTAGRDIRSNWDSHNEKGTEFIWILKKIPFKDNHHKFSYFIPWPFLNKLNIPSWCDAKNTCFKQTPIDVFKRYGYTSNKIDDILKLLVGYNKKVSPPAPEKTLEQINKEYLINWYKSVENVFLTNIDDELEHLVFWALGEEIHPYGFNRSFLGSFFSDTFDLKNEDFLEEFADYFYDELNPAIESLFSNIGELIDKNNSYYEEMGDLFYYELVKDKTKRFTIVGDDSDKIINYLLKNYDFLESFKEVIVNCIYNNQKYIDFFSKFINDFEKKMVKKH